MLIPGSRLLQAAAAVAAGGVYVAAQPAAFGPWLGVVAALALVAALDAVQVARCRTPQVERLIAGALPLGVRQDVRLRLTNRMPMPLKVAVQDHCPDGCEAEGLPLALRLGAQGWTVQAYQLKPVRRGELRFEALSLRIDSPLGLWQSQRRVPVESTVRVYPNFAALTRYALFATDHRLSQLGVLQRRRRGEGLDFHQLREYREGDSTRQIDWKASARMRKLISREYQDERDQQVVLLLDCGRRMGAQDGELSHFDHALNAALLLAYVSMRQGDAVGLMTTAGAERWLAPRKSRSVDALLNAVYDLQPTLAATDYYLAATALMQRLRKRALVVILTNLRDEDDDSLVPALRLLRRRHLVVLASLRERALVEALEAPVRRLDDALTHAATADYLRQREAAFRRIAGAGVQAFDVEPQRLPITLVNRYLEIKRAGSL